MTVNGAGWKRSRTQTIYEPLRHLSYNWLRDIKEDISQFVIKSLALRFAQREQYMILFEDLNSSRDSFFSRDLAVRQETAGSLAIVGAFRNILFAL